MAKLDWNRKCNCWKGSFGYNISTEKTKIKNIWDFEDAELKSKNEDKKSLKINSSHLNGCVR